MIIGSSIDCSVVSLCIPIPFWGLSVQEMKTHFLPSLSQLCISLCTLAQLAVGQKQLVSSSINCNYFAFRIFCSFWFYDLLMSRSHILLFLLACRLIIIHIFNCLLEKRKEVSWWVIFLLLLGCFWSWFCFFNRCWIKVGRIEDKLNFDCLTISRQFARVPGPTFLLVTSLIKIVVDIAGLFRLLIDLASFTSRFRGLPGLPGLLFELINSFSIERIGYSLPVTFPSSLVSFRLVLHFKKVKAIN